MDRSPFDFPLQRSRATFDMQLLSFGCNAAQAGNEKTKNDTRKKPCQE
jgi:hypothetical protein